MNKRVFLWTAVIIGIAAIIFGVSRLAQEKTEVGVLSSDVATVTERDQVKGQPLARTTLIEYSDLQCPACRAYYPVVKKLADDFRGKIRIVYRHYPLTKLHRNAYMAALAAEAAAKQGKFWEMHDLLFERQEQWSGSSDVKKVFIEYAKEMGLNAEQFAKDIDSSDVSSKVDTDIASGNKGQVKATPTFFLNGTQLSTPNSYDNFKKIIEQELANTAR
jgi:protein-disulfide isomerase